MQSLSSKLMGGLGSLLDAKADEEEREKEEEEILLEIRKQQKKVCLCFKKKRNVDLEEKIIQQAMKSDNFKVKLEEEKFDLAKLVKTQGEQVIEEKLEKAEHSRLRKFAIR